MNILGTGSGVGYLITDIAGGYTITVSDEVLAFIVVLGIIAFMLMCFDFVFGMILLFVRFIKRRVTHDDIQ